MKHFSRPDVSQLIERNSRPNMKIGNRVVNQFKPADRTLQQPDAQSKRSTEFIASFFERLLDKSHGLPVRIVLPGDKEILHVDNQFVGTIKILDTRTAWAIAIDPLFQFCEAYTNGKIEIQGDMAKCLTAIYQGMNTSQSQTLWQRMLNTLRRPGANTLKGSKQNIHHHYNLGNDFYRLWLDERMLYTCAYFSRPGLTLEQAQLAKMDHVCRKLRLKPGMDVVEAGCGWGALAMHMAKHYGVRVRAFNISNEQITFAQETARRQGLADRVEFVQDDWRNISRKYDAFASVGMLEHVGVKNFPTLGQTILRSLKPNGLGLIHTIGQNKPVPLNSWIERRIFPGAYVPTLKQMMEIFEPGNFQILDLENLRLHYAETLRRWLERFENSQESVRQKFDDRFVRMWRMYLAGSVAAFESGFLQLYQVVFANGASNKVPRTREQLYDTPNNRVGRVIKSIADSNRSSIDNEWGEK